MAPPGRGSRTELVDDPPGAFLPPTTAERKLYSPLNLTTRLRCRFSHFRRTFDRPGTLPV